MNIYVSNLNYKTSDEELKTIFEEYGTVTSAKVIVDKYTGKSRGFGFVEMENQEEAKKAIEELNQAEFDGKQISVAEARPRTENNERRGNNNNFGRRNNDRRDFRRN